MTARKTPAVPFARKAVPCLVLLSVAALLVGGPKDEKSPVKAAIEKITADFGKAVHEADERYRKLIQPIARRRVQAIEHAGKGAVARLERVAREAKQMGSDLGEGLAKAEVARINKAVDDARAARPAGAWTVGFEGHRYLAVVAPVTWSEGRQVCKDMGGHLAYLETKEEMKFLQTLTRGIGCWVGCTDKHKEGNWRWLNGAPVDRSLWDRPEPDNAWGGQDVGFLGGKGLGDTHDHKRVGFICEWE
jgi:hypothetical protein